MASTDMGAPTSWVGLPLYLLTASLTPYSEYYSITLAFPTSVVDLLQLQ
jgi:hypothetical protein